MIKREIRSRIKNYLPKYDQDNKYHPLVIDNAIEKAIIALYTVEFDISPRRLFKYVKRYGGTTALPILQDLNANIYYCNYPEKIVSFPDNASGVRRLTTRQQGGMTFFPTNQQDMEFIVSGTNFKTINTKIGYIPTLERIEFYNMSTAVSLTGIRADIIIPFSKYLDTDDVIIPEVKDKDGLNFDDLVLKVLGVIQPPDAVDDNKTSFNTQPQNNN